MRVVRCGPNEVLPEGAETSARPPSRYDGYDKFVTIILEWALENLTSCAEHFAENARWLERGARDPSEHPENPMRENSRERLDEARQWSLLEVRVREAIPKIVGAFAAHKRGREQIVIVKDDKSKKPRKKVRS